MHPSADFSNSEPGKTSTSTGAFEWRREGWSRLVGLPSAFSSSLHEFRLGIPLSRTVILGLSYGTIEGVANGVQGSVASRLPAYPSSSWAAKPGELRCMVLGKLVWRLKWGRSSGSALRLSEVAHHGCIL